MILGLAIIFLDITPEAQFIKAQTWEACSACAAGLLVKQEGLKLGALGPPAQGSVPPGGGPRLAQAWPCGLVR